MTKTIESLFYWNLFITDILFILLFFIYFKRSKTFRPIWLIFIYTFINLTINSIVEFFPFINKKGMYLLYSSFTFIEFALFTGFIILFIKNAFYKKIMIALSILFSIFLPFYYSNAIQGSIDSVPIGIETLFILLFDFYYFYEQMNDMDNHYIYYRYHFWIIIGMMLYLAGSFFIYIFANHVDIETQNQFWFLTYFFYVVKNIFFIIGIINYSKRLKSQSIKDLYPYLN